MATTTARVTLLHENGAKWVSEYIGVDYDHDEMLDTAVESILGDGDERIRATRRPEVKTKRKSSVKQRRAGEWGGATPSSIGGRSDLIDFSGIGGGVVDPNPKRTEERRQEEEKNLLLLPGGKHYDLVLVDSTDFGVATPLFTKSFYQNVRKILNPQQGILVFNCESPSWAERTVNIVQHFLSSMYRHSYVYQLAMPTYSSGHYSFLMASDNIHPYKTKIDWEKMEEKNILDSMEYYTPELHYGAFALPAKIRHGKRIKRTDLAASLVEQDDENEDEEEEDEEEEEEEDEEDEEDEDDVIEKKKRKQNAKSLADRIRASQQKKKKKKRTGRETVSSERKEL